MLRLLLAFLLLLPSLARADDPAPLRVMLAPFGESDPATALYDAIELDLELVERIVLTDASPLTVELAGRSLLALSEAERARLLGRLAQDAVLVARVDGLPAGAAIVGVVRAADGALVFVERVELEAAIEEPRAVVVGRMLEVIADLDTAEAFSREDLIAAGLVEEEPAPEGFPAGDAEPGVQPTSKPTSEPASEPVEVPGAGARGLGQVALLYAPALLHYQACQPRDSAAWTPFACVPAEGAGPTEVTLLTPVGGALALELFPVPWVGLMVSGSLLQSTIRARAGDVVLVEPFTAVGGDVTVAPVLRGSFHIGALDAFAGGRAGYHLSFMFTGPHGLALDDGAGKALDPDARFNVLPSWLSHAALVGGTAGVLLGPARIAIEADALLSYHYEFPNYVGSSPLGLGARGALSCDIDIGAGLYATALLSGTALAARTAGPGRRLTRDLEVFRGGQIVLAEARLGLGLGYRF